MTATLAEIPPRSDSRPRRAERRVPSRPLFVESTPGGDPELARFVFLHGLGATHRYWTAADGHRWLPPGALLVDLYGFGRSPRPLRRYTLDTHLAALDAVLADEAHLTLVGHSLGAALALAFAARHPERVDALVLMALPAYGGRRAARRWLRPRPRGWLFTNMALTAVACIATRRLLAPLVPRVVRDIPPVVARDMVEHNVLSSTTSLWEVLYRHDAAADLDALPDRIAVAFIHGDRDTTAPITAVEALAGGRDTARLLTLPDVDHHPWLRQPADCAALIDARLA